MGFISILIALFGGYILWYAVDTPLMHSVTQQYLMIGGGFLFGGLFLYVYLKNLNQTTNCPINC